MNYKMPERRINPPTKYATIPHCPQCGSDEIGVIEDAMIYSSVLSWDDGKPDELEIQETLYTRYHDPKYYCPYCGDEFNTPDMRKVEVI